MAYLIDANGEELNVGSPAVLDNISPRSITCWLKITTGVTGAWIIGKGYLPGGTTFDGWQIVHFIDSGTDILEIGAGFTLGINWWHTTGSPTSLPQETWFHLGCTYDDASSANDPLIYIDGVLQTVNNLARPGGTVTGDADNPLLIGNIEHGSVDSQRPLNGRIARVAIHNVILTQAEIETCMRRGPVQRGLVWAGDLVNSGRDLSGNGNDATVTNATVIDGPPAMPWIGHDDDLMVPGAVGQTIAVGQVIETNLAQGLTVLKQRTLAQAVEADLAQAINSVKARAIGQVTEADLAQTIAWAPRHRLVGRVTETNLAQVLSRLKTLELGQVTETDLAQALSVAGEFFIGVGQVTEADLAQAVSWAPKHRLIGQVMETDLAQALSVLKRLGVGQVTEADLGQPLGVLKMLGVGQVVEVDLAQALSVLRTYGVGQVTEVDLAQGINAQRRYVVAQVTETDLARVLSYFRVVHVGTVVETDVALVISISGGAPIALPPYLGGVGSPLLVFGGGVAEAIVVFGGGVAVSARVFGGDVDLPVP